MLHAERSGGAPREGGGRCGRDDGGRRAVGSPRDPERIVAFPWMGRTYCRRIQRVLESLGLKVVMPPEISDRTVKLGVRNSADMMCFPFKVILGNFIEALENGANTLIMYDSCGQCRFRHYFKIHEFTLRKLGYEFDIFAINGKSIFPVLKKLSGKSTLAVYQAVRELVGALHRIDAKRYQWRPGALNIGIIGETYTCCEEKVNYHIEQRLRELGTNPYNTACLSDFIDESHNQLLLLPSSALLRPKKGKYKKAAMRYLNGPLGGHGYENIYNLLWMKDMGVDGVIHILPLSCMPEATVEPILSSICQESGIPLLRLLIDETNSKANVDTRVETFVELIKRSNRQKEDRSRRPRAGASARTRCWLGIDCGSVSVKLALVDEEGRVLKSAYLRNMGITETIQAGLRQIRDERYEVAGVGCTGSGRQFVGLLVGADVVKTEVLAHTIATLHFRPDVRTIMDIGGEDCKIMEVKDGVLTNFAMNNICGAGTGAVVEAIASRLGVPIEEVGDLALSSKHKLDFPGKCGIFCQSTVVSRLNSGAARSDILMGVVRALASNYLTLSKGSRLEPPYVFQGATAKNKAIVRSLEEELRHEVIVLDECAIMGAIGIALMALRANVQETKFRGFEIPDLDYETVNFRCYDCPNRCEVTQLYEDGRLLGCVGSRCAKWNDVPYESTPAAQEDEMAQERWRGAHPSPV